MPLLDEAEMRVRFRGDEAHGDTGFPGAARAADAVAPRFRVVALQNSLLEPALASRILSTWSSNSTHPFVP